MLEPPPPAAPTFGPPPPWSVDGSTVAIFVPLAGLLLVVGIILGRLSNTRKISSLEQANLDKQLDMITQCLCDQADSSNGRLQHPLVLLRAQDFLVGNGIRKYEDCRRAGQHIVLDSTEQLKHFERKQRIIVRCRDPYPDRLCAL